MHNLQMALRHAVAWRPIFDWAQVIIVLLTQIGKDKVLSKQNMYVNIKVVGSLLLTP